MTQQKRAISRNHLKAKMKLNLLVFLGVHLSNSFTSGLKIGCNVSHETVLMKKQLIGPSQCRIVDKEDENQIVVTNETGATINPRAENPKVYDIEGIHFTEGKPTQFPTHILNNLPPATTGQQYVTFCTQFNCLHFVNESLFSFGLGTSCPTQKTLMIRLPSSIDHLCIIPFNTLNSPNNIDIRVDANKAYSLFYLTTSHQNATPRVEFTVTPSSTTPPTPTVTYTLEGHSQFRDHRLSLVANTRESRHEVGSFSLFLHDMTKYALIDNPSIKTAVTSVIEKVDPEDYFINTVYNKYHLKKENNSWKLDAKDNFEHEITFAYEVLSTEHMLRSAWTMNSYYLAFFEQFENDPNQKVKDLIVTLKAIPSLAMEVNKLAKKSTPIIQGYSKAQTKSEEVEKLFALIRSYFPDPPTTGDATTTGNTPTTGNAPTIGDAPVTVAEEKNYHESWKSLSGKVFNLIQKDGDYIRLKWSVEDYVAEMNKVKASLAAVVALKEPLIKLFKEKNFDLRELEPEVKGPLPLWMKIAGTAFIALMVGGVVWLVMKTAKMEEEKKEDKAELTEAFV